VTYQNSGAAGLAELITVGSAARLLGLSENYVRRLAEAGVLPPHRTAYGRLFNRGDVERLATERAARPKAGRT
jgi:excisionase family DNA binding protein